MLGRNATRSLVSPSRLISGYSSTASQRIAQLIARPLAMVHMQRYLSVAPQLLITHQPNSSSGSIDLTLSASPSSSCSSSSAAAAVHSSAASLQLPHAQEVLLEKQQPSVASASTLSSTHPTPSSSSPSATHATTATATSTTAAAATPSTSPAGSAVAFNYLLAASWHPKSRNPRRTSDSLSARSAPMTPGSEDTDTESENEDDARNTKWWKQKLRAGKVDAGEDAFFHVSTPSRVALGVADGVGGWSEVGVDPALFSWALMDNAEAVARLTDADHHSDSKGGRSSKVPLDAQSILDGAYTELVESGKVQAGSSTACILSLCKVTGTLRASNLGDSAYLLIRDNQCIYESPSQQHFWNCPYQLTVLPPGYPRAKQYVMDMPKDAAQTTHQLQDGDVIVLATDGFWDNVFTKEAIELVERELGDVIQQLRSAAAGASAGAGAAHPANGSGLSSPTSDGDIVGRVRALSQRLTNTARRFSLDQKRRTPFSQSARHIRSGGKIDDITVIVTLVRALKNHDHTS